MNVKAMLAGDLLGYLGYLRQQMDEVRYSSLWQSMIDEAIVIQMSWLSGEANAVMAELNWRNRQDTLPKATNGYSTEQIADLKAHSSIVRISYALTGRPPLSNGNPRRWKVLCPFHEDTKPSLVLYSDQNSFYCFGCQQGGDVIRLVMKLKECNFLEAMAYLEERDGQTRVHAGVGEEVLPATGLGGLT